MKEVTSEVLAESCLWKQAIPGEMGIRVAVGKEAFRREMRRLYVIKFLMSLYCIITQSNETRKCPKNMDNKCIYLHHLVSKARDQIIP